MWEGLGRRRRHLAMVAGVGALLAILARPAEAQFLLGARGGFGYGYGNGLGGGYYGAIGFNRHPSEVLFLEQHALQVSGRASGGPAPYGVYGRDPNAYSYHVRDVGRIERIDPGVRRAIEAKVGRFSDGPPPGPRRRARPVAVLPSPQSSDPRPDDRPPARPEGAEPAATSPSPSPTTRPE